MLVTRRANIYIERERKKQRLQQVPSQAANSYGERKKHLSQDEVYGMLCDALCSVSLSDAVASAGHIARSHGASLPEPT